MKTHPTDDLVRTMARVRDDALAGFADRPAARNLLNEVMTLAPDDEAGSGTAQRSARRPKTSTRLLAVGALAVTMAVGVTVAQNLGGTDGRGKPRPIVPGIPAGPVANAAELLDRAAAAVETPPSTAPRPDQWIFIEHKQFFPAVGTRVNTPGERLVPFVERTWWRADGRQKASTQEGRYGDGKLRIEDGAGGWKHHYPTLAMLPTDPDALRAAVEANQFAGSTERGGTAEQRASLLYDAYSAILRNGVAPPKVEAAIFRAIKTIPGVTLNKNAVDVAGRPAVAVARVDEGYLNKEILLDRTTYRYMGERIIVIKDHTSTGEDGTWREKKGAILNLETRTAWSIVDRPGQRP
jgi:hypothetical protein